MSRKKPYFLKRVVAYLIDIILVALLSGAIALVFVDSSKSKGYTDELLSLTQKLTNNEITQEEYTKEANTINYYHAKDTVNITIINVSVAIVYYVVLCFYCGGITLGKSIMKLRIVGVNDKKLNLGHYLIRGLFVNMILINILNAVFVLFFSKEVFINVYLKINNVLTISLLVTLVFMMYREDGRGLHDLIASTQVINTKEDKNNVVKEEVKEEITEAKVIEEKKTKQKKSNTKKGSVNK